MIKTLEKIETVRYFLNMINFLYLKTKTIILLNGETLEALLQDQEPDKDTHYLYYFHYYFRDIS